MYFTTADKKKPAHNKTLVPKLIQCGGKAKRVCVCVCASVYVCVCVRVYERMWQFYMQASKSMSRAL